MRDSEQSLNHEPRFPRGFVLPGAALTLTPGFCPDFRRVFTWFSTAPERREGWYQ